MLAKPLLSLPMGPVRTATTKRLGWIPNCEEAVVAKVCLFLFPFLGSLADHVHHVVQCDEHVKHVGQFKHVG